MAISCCHGCMAPKRYPGCHDVCPDYLKEKAAHDALREEDYKRRRTIHDLNEQRYRGVTKAVKHKRKADKHGR